MKLKNVKRIEPKLARCIEVDTPDRLFTVGADAKESVVTHNSVVQRNIIFATIMRPDRWRFLGIDLKKVELSAFRAYSETVLGIATTIEDALTVLRFAQETMMKRYEELEQLGLNNFTSLPEAGQALLVMVDEAGELLSPSGVKALSENTPIPTLNGITELKNLNVGDIILDNYSNPTTITNKYEPVEQDQYKMSIRRDSDSVTEKITAGSEHNWVAYFENPDGTVEGPKLVDTYCLYEFKQNQKMFPEHERIKVKFRKNG